MGSKLVRISNTTETLFSFPYSLDRVSTLTVTTAARGPKAVPYRVRAEYADIDGRKSHEIPGEFSAIMAEGAGEVRLYFKALDIVNGQVHVQWRFR